MIERLSAGFLTVVVMGTVASVLVAQSKPPNGESASEGIAGPDNWIPLTYEEVTKVDGVITHSYTHYRASNGSTRRERGDGRESVISNRERNLYFLFRSGGWRQHPARAQIKNGMPFLQIARKGSKLIPVSDARLKAFAAVPEMLTFYEVAFGDGKDVHIFVPELNMLEAWTRRQAPYGLVQTEVTWIALGEPFVQLEPPPGAPISISNVPDGPGRP